MSLSSYDSHERAFGPIWLLIIPLAIFVGWRVYVFVTPHSYQPPAVEKIACFNTFVEGYKPGNLSVQAALADLRRTVPRTVDPAYERETLRNVRSAEAACSPEKCEGDARKAYRDAINQYIGHRMNQILQMDMRAGPPGATHMARQLRSGEDTAILRGFEARLKTGVYRITRRDESATYQLFFSAPPEKIFPCGRVAAPAG
jgi:hypothetical protein